MEETGLEIKNIRFLCVSNFKLENKHYVDIGFAADWKAGEAYTREPEKCEGWNWYDPNTTPVPLFLVDVHYLNTIKTGVRYYDA